MYFYMIFLNIIIKLYDDKSSKQIRHELILTLPDLTWVHENSILFYDCVWILNTNSLVKW